MESISASLVLLALYYIELFWNIPLVKQLIKVLSVNIEQQTAFAFLIVKMMPFFLLSLFYDPIYKLLVKLSPPTSEEDLSKPKFITEKSLEDTTMALLLIENEQTSIFERFSQSIDNIREEKESVLVHDFFAIHKSNMVLISEIDLYLKRIIGFHLSHDDSELYVQLQNRQNLLKSLDDAVFSFVDAIHENQTSDRMAILMQTFTESLHLNFITASEATKSKNRNDINLLLKMTDDKGALMERIRKVYLVDIVESNSEHKAALLYVTDLFQRTAWLLNGWAKAINTNLF